MLLVINLDDFKKIIEHAPDRNNQIEKANCEAIQIDSDDGLACFLGFLSGTLSKVDYCDIKNPKVRFIELSDLRQKIREAQSVVIPDNRQSRRTAWAPLVDEFKLKYQGTVAIYERLRQQNNILDDPEYQLFIVCKNGSDIQILDILKTRLEGMIQGGVRICRTENICNMLV